VTWSDSPPPPQAAWSIHRLIYGDDTDVPDLHELAVIVDGKVHSGLFDNRPSA
jgi:hypothetical protein